MATKDKKNKKKTTMSLAVFHASVSNEPSSSTNNQQQQPSASSNSRNWAEEMEMLDSVEPPKPTAEILELRSQLPTAPKSTLAPDINLDQIPKNGPFTVHLSNVNFEADDAKIRAFFHDSKILNVRLPVDERGRFRGFGQIDFEDRESLINALGKNETKFFNRPIKVQLESAYKQQRQQQQGGGGGRYQQREGQEISTGTTADEDKDWRRREPEPEPEPQPVQQQQQQQRQFNNYNNNNRQQQGSTNNRYGNNQYQQQQQQQSQQAGGGGYQRRNPYGQQKQEGGGRTDGYTRQSYGGQQQPRQYVHRDRTSGEHLPSTTEQSNTEQSQPQPQQPEIRERPKIVLLPRSKQEPPAVPSTLENSSSSSNVFGSAKPVDTAAKLREIEEKLRREAEEKQKEADEAAAAAAAAAASGETK
jgi:translation initiation factor 4B